MDDGGDETIREHYREQAEKYGDSPLSTMLDETVREKEVAFITRFCGAIGAKRGGGLRILDLGCGNGYTLSVVVAAFPENRYWGLEYSKEMLAVAVERGPADCELVEGDARAMPFDDGFFDAVYTERCLINLPEWEQQERALREIGRVLKPGGYYLMMESFVDGLRNNNKARVEVGMHELKEARHNKYLEQEKVFEAVEGFFRRVEPGELDPERGEELPASNFLSSHYFIARVLHPLVTKGEWVRNTEFVKFFSFLPPVGNYSPIQAYIFEKTSDG